MSSTKEAVCGMHLSLCEAPRPARGRHCGLVPLTVQTPARHMASGGPDWWRRARLRLSGHRPSPYGGGGSLTPPHSISLAFSFPASKMGKEAASPVPDALCPLQGRMGRRMSIPLYCHFSDMSHQTQQPESGP